MLLWLLSCLAGCISAKFWFWGNSIISKKYINFYSRKKKNYFSLWFSNSSIAYRVFDHDHINDIWGRKHQMDIAMEHSFTRSCKKLMFFLYSNDLIQEGPTQTKILYLHQTKNSFHVRSSLLSSHQHFPDYHWFPHGKQHIWLLQNTGAVAFLVLLFEIVL